MRGEEVEPLGRALIERPLLAALARDELPELEVLARDVIGSLVHLHLVPAAHETDGGRLKGLEPSESGKEVAPQLAAFVGSRSGARSAVRAPAELRSHGELAVTLVDALAEPLCTDSRGRPDHRRAWWHVVRDYPAGHMSDKTFREGAEMRQ